MSTTDFALIEMHPKLGFLHYDDDPERFARSCRERGFDPDGIESIVRRDVKDRAKDLRVPGRPMVDDHLQLDGDDYIVKRVTWTFAEFMQVTIPICTVHALYNGKAGKECSST